jgi:hypothetical protein
VTVSQHATRILVLMAATSALLTWDMRHTEATSVDGLRSIHQAEQIHEGAWRQGLIGSIDHPVHPLGIVAMHGLVGGSGPVSWQRAAVAWAFGCIVLLAIPAYLLTREILGDRTAWLGPLLLLVHPLFGEVVANVLSQSAFLLLWTWGLWAAARFLREGRFGWLVLAVALGVLAYLARPEGLLLPLALAATLVILPLHPGARINWPRWRAAVAVLVLGPVVLAAPYMILKGRVATRPAVARVLGLEPQTHSEAVERELPLPPEQTTWQAHGLAVERVLGVLREVVPLPLAVLAVIGLASVPASPFRTRACLFFGILLAASCLGLVRLHATGGYAATRHGLVPGILLLLASAHGLAAAASRIEVPGRWLGLGRGPYRPGPAVWGLVVAAMIVSPRIGQPAAMVLGPYHNYRDAADWIRQNTGPADRVLDMTDWSLYFSERAGHGFAEVHLATADPHLRWVIVRQPHLMGHWNYTRVLRSLIGGRSPAVAIPPQPEPGQHQVLIYDRLSQAPSLAGVPGSAVRR